MAFLFLLSYYKENITCTVSSVFGFPIGSFVSECITYCITVQILYAVRTVAETIFMFNIKATYCHYPHIRDLYIWHQAPGEEAYRSEHMNKL